jgi:glycosyltransferase involved in cell wall biosynthesis
VPPSLDPLRHGGHRLKARANYHSFSLSLEGQAPAESLATRLLSRAACVALNPAPPTLPLVTSQVAVDGTLPDRGMLSAYFEGVLRGRPMFEQLSAFNPRPTTVTPPFGMANFWFSGSARGRTVSGTNQAIEMSRTASSLVSVVVPTKNRFVLLQQTIASIQAQSHRSWEAIVVDDGSTDESAGWIQGLAERDERVKWIPRPSARRAGASTCRNIGLQHAHGEYVIFLDSDDLLSPSCLEQRVAHLSQSPHLDFMVFQAEVFAEKPGDSGFILNVADQRYAIDRLLSLDHPWQTSGPIWRRESLQSIGGWDEALPSWQDWELHLRALCRGLAFAEMNICDYWYRVDSSDKNKTSVKQQRDAEHLNAAVSLFAKVLDELRRTGNNTLVRQRELAGLAFETALKWKVHHGVIAALVAWRRAYAKRLTNLRYYAAGVSILIGLRLPLIRFFVHSLILPRFKQRIGLGRYENTFRKIRFSDSGYTWSPPREVRRPIRETIPY